MLRLLQHGRRNREESTTLDDDKIDQYRALIQFKGKYIHLGMARTAEEAALIYNKDAIKLFGEYAYLNKITY